MMKCFLPVTEIELLDGNKYKFRQLPATRQTAPMIDAFHKSDGNSVNVSNLIEMITISLSYDQDEATIDGLFENGIISVISSDKKAGEVLEKIFGAMFPKS